MSRYRGSRIRGGRSNHYCRLSALHLLIADAVAAQDRVRVTGLTFEHEVADSSATDPSKRYKLYTLVGTEPKVACIPDSGMVLHADGRRRAFFVEYETGSDGPARVCALKHMGYALLHATRKYQRIYPDAADFRVLCFCPYDSWRRTMIEQMWGKPGEGLWLFLTTPQVTPGNFLHGDLVYKTDAGPMPLVPAPASATPAPGGEAGGGGTGGAREAVNT